MSVRSKKRLLFFVLWVSLVLATALVPRSTGGQQSISKPASPGIAQRVKTIFAERCFQCHGLNGKAAKNIFALDRALALYAPQDAIDRAIAEDEARFLRAKQELGGKYASKRWDTNAQTEPVNALSRRFESELPMAMAAAEAGLEARDFYDRIRWNTRLNRLGLGQLLAPGGAIKRDVWEKHFADVARELQLGVHLPGQRLATRRHSTGATGDNALLFSNAARQRVVQTASAQPAPSGGSAQNESSDLLRSARTVFVGSNTVYLRPESLEDALRGRADFQSLDVAIVKDRQAADLVIDLNRPLFTFDFTYSVTHRQSSKLVASGKVTAFDGNGAAPKIAKVLIKQMQSARSRR